jgi:hypothetical protein
MAIGPVQLISPLDLIEIGLGPTRARAEERDPGQPTATHGGGQPRSELVGSPGARLGASPAAGRDPR